MIMLLFYELLIVLAIIIAILLALFPLYLKYNTKKIKKKEKETLLRHKENNYTPFETEVIKRICSDELFAYYYFYCPNENTWLDILKKLTPDEKVIELCVSNVKIGGFISKGYPLSTLFLTNKGRIFFYKMSVLRLYSAKANYYYTISIGNIEKADIKINHHMSGVFKYSIPTEVKIILNDKSTIIISNMPIALAEYLRDLCWQIKTPDQDKEISKLSSEERIKKALDEMLDKGRISDDKYEKLKKQIGVSTKACRMKIRDERLHEK